MKELNKFLREQNEEEGARPLKDGEGADDKEFFELMSQYKDVRRKDPKAAKLLLTQAQELEDVSPKVKLAAAYL